MKKLILVPAFILNLTPLFSEIHSDDRRCHCQWLSDIVDEGAGKKTWSKSVWSTIAADQLINSAVFLPLNEAVTGYDYSDGYLNLALFDTEKSKIKWNLWTILKYHLLKGELTFYSPRNPEWWDTRDDGFLLYPTTTSNYGESSNGTIFSDPKFDEFVKFEGYLGFYDYSSYLQPIMSIEYPDEDSLINGETVYYPREFLWYKDENILRYRIRETWTINENGEVQDKIIESIAPVVNRVDASSREIIGQMELFWIDFAELRPLLVGYYVLLDRYRTERVISYFDYFEDREFYATVEKTEEVQIRKE